MEPLGSLVPNFEDIVVPDKGFKQGRTLPLKLELLCGNSVMGESDMPPPEISTLVRTGEAIDVEAVDIDAGLSNDSGSLFRYSDDLWIYNLKTSNLSSGTYKISLNTPEGINLKSGFVLK